MDLDDPRSKAANENPYQDNKTRTSYGWKEQNEIFKGVKESQNLFNDSIKKKNYFYPHIGIGGGAGNIFNTTSKTKMTLEVKRRRNIPVANSYGKNQPKYKQHQHATDSLNRTGKSNALFPTVNKEQWNQEQLQKSLLCTGINKKVIQDFTQKGLNCLILH